MKARPTIFISGVSHEFGSFRDAVENEIEMKGCFAENQPGFPPDYRTVEAMLRPKLHDADTVIHIVGFRFGAEPNQRPADAPRRSYTQMEFDIARKMQKPVFVFLSTDASVRDAPKPEEKTEDAEATALQLAHRDAVQTTNHLFYFFKDKAELCKLVAEIPPVQAAGFHADISRIVKYAPAELIGRDDELKVLNDAWLKVRRAESPRPRILTFVALGGEGKTSLVAKWAAELAAQDWPGCDAAFAWSFYSQGTREQLAASSDLFLKEALTFFGDDADKQFAASPAGAFEKGQRLARIVGQRRSLLILDGLEPLQYAPASPTPGQLKDQGIAALLKGLAAASHGLCVVTTRYSLPDLKAFWQTTAPEVKLLRLSREAGVHLLKMLGVTGTAKEFETLVEDVKGHALTLTLLGGFLKRAFHGDIRQRDRVKFEKADEKMDGGHAFRTMAAYEQWLLRDGGEEGRREVAVLRLMGLFDRPADAGCLAALRSETIPGLTEPLAGLADDDWEFCLSGLEAAKLLTVNRDATGLVSLDAHPHLREYFARQLRTQQPDAWCAAHRRLYEHLCATTADQKPNPSLEELQPVFQAAIHGCLANRREEVLDFVYKARIAKWPPDSDGEGWHYSARVLGAWGNTLACLAGFFQDPWAKPSGEIQGRRREFVLQQAGWLLRSTGRFSEAVIALEQSWKDAEEMKSWHIAGVSCRNLNQIYEVRGELRNARRAGENAVRFSKLSENRTEQVKNVTRLAGTLHIMGDLAEAENYFKTAEISDSPEKAPDSVKSGYEFFLLGDLLVSQGRNEAAVRVADKALAAARRIKAAPIVPALANLVKGRAYLAQLRSSDANDFKETGKLFETCMQQLRENGEVHQLPRGLLARAEFHLLAREFDACMIDLDEARELSERTEMKLWLAGYHLLRARLRFLSGARTGPESAQEDLDEAWEIAERGPMKLFLADIHLHRARLFGSQRSENRGQKYPWQSPQHDLAEARKLIEKCGYGRRKEELEDAEKAILAT